AQLWFLGRVSHPVFLNGDLPWAPSAIRPDQHVHAPSGERLDCVTPHEMSRQDIRVAIEDLANGAKNAMDVGFDGVQVHGANGYIIDQFLRDGANQRSDEYGGSVANRLRFMRESVAACCDVAGEGRVAVRLSPLNPYNDMRDSNPAALFAEAAAALNEFPLSFLEIVEGLPGHFLHAPGGPVLPEIRRRYQGVLIANGGYQFENAAAAVEAGDVDGVSFGVPFISNPDLVDRFRRDAPLAAPDAETFYTAGEKGYLDYPTYDEKPESGAAYQGLQLEDARKH
ncbi:MAG: alkene reductase, partial [Pseudomonadota bacterium]